MSTELHPTRTSDRIQALDLLRGFAVLGILIMNIQSYSMPGSAYLNPTSYGNFDGINRWVWMVSHIAADQKFMTIFSILFGAGIVLVTQNAESRNGKSAGLHYKRTFWLLVIGLLHAHLIWYGDILVPYALCGLFVYLFRKLKAFPLIIMGILMISIHSLIYWFFGTSLEHWPAEAIASAKASWVPDSQMINKEIAAVNGSVAEQIWHNSQAAIFMETLVFASLFLWRAGGLMLVGMALYKWGVLTAQRSAAFYKRGFAISLVTGLPIVIFGMFINFNAGWSFEYSMYLGSQFNYWGSLPISFGYICIVMWFAQTHGFTRFKNRIAAIGQMALTNYLSQSILCILIFHGIGFGLFGHIERTGQVVIVLLIWVLQIVWSRPWLEKYLFGPMEWVWRSLTYGRLQKMNKDSDQ